MTSVENLNSAAVWTAIDLVSRFGPLPLNRLRHDPAPGTATEVDLLRIYDQEGRLYELVDGTLVEKAMGTYESYLAMQIGRKMGDFVEEHGLGIVLGADGMMRFARGLVRIPDVSFISSVRMQSVDLTQQAIADLVPDLAVEVISVGNTQQEMDSKLREYFDKGVRLVWYVYPKTKKACIYHSPSDARVISELESLNGEEVLPGFTLALESVFRV